MRRQNDARAGPRDAERGPRNEQLGGALGRKNRGPQGERQAALALLGEREQPHGLTSRRDWNREARLQAAVVAWARAAAPSVLIFHPANGGWRSRSGAARFKWHGVVAGIPDLAIVAPGGRAFFLECKTDRGALSAEQRCIHDPPRRPRDGVRHRAVDR